jgi:hypothetical protein
MMGERLYSGTIRKHAIKVYTVESTVAASTSSDYSFSFEMARSDIAGEADEPWTLPHRDNPLILCSKLTRLVTRLEDGEGRKISVSSRPLKIALSLLIGEISRIEIGETGTASELVWAGSAASAAQWVRVPAAAPNLRNLPPMTISSTQTFTKP